jgi:aminotransferase
MPSPSCHMAEVSQALSIKYNNIVYEMKARGEDVTVLSLGEAFFDIPLFPFDDLPFPALYHYGHSRGLLDLRRQLATFYREQHNVDVDPATEIIVTAGSKVAIHMSLMSLLDPGDEVLIHEPAWLSYAEQIKLCFGRTVAVPCGETVFDFPKYLTPRVKAIIVNNPHNPRGSVLSEKELRFLHDLALEHDLFLVADEAYSEFLDDDAFVSAGAFDPAKSHTVICNSISKNYGMSGWRIGYVIAGRPVIDEILKVTQHLITCPATILEHYLSRHFHEILAITKPQIRRVVATRRRVAAYMDEIGLQRLPGDATFYFFVSISPSGLTSDEFCNRLLRGYRISAVPGIGYGSTCDQFIRISVGTEPMERIVNALRTIKSLITETTPNVSPAQGARSDRGPASRSWR